MSVKIIVELLEVHALATEQIKQGRFSKFVFADLSHLAQRGAEKLAKTLIGENNIEAVLQRLDRLTMEESRMTVTQTMKVVMDGREALLDFPSQRAKSLSF